MSYGVVQLLLESVAEMSYDGVFWTVLKSSLIRRRMVPNKPRFQG